MKQIAIVVYDDCWAMSVFSVADFFRIISLLEKHLGNEESYEVNLVSLDGKPVKCAGGFPAFPTLSLSTLTSPDLVVIPPIEGSQLKDPTHDYTPISHWLAKLITNRLNEETAILSLTTGADILAGTGLFTDKVLCTHWAFISPLKRKYPNNKFTSHESFLVEDNIYSTGSLNGTFDALLAFVAQDKGDKFAQICASHLLVAHPSQVTPLLFKHRNHTDNAILKVQDWIDSNFQADIQVDALAEKFGFSVRNLKRRFVLATKLPPNKYLQKVRIDKAKKLLISTTTTVKEVAYNVGYDNDSFFNRLFKENTGMTMAQWRKNTIGH